MLKRILFLVVAVAMLCGTVVLANSENRDTKMHIGEYRYLFFATDGGIGVNFLNLPYGTRVNLDDYIPEKVGYEFEGWYENPNSGEERITTIILEDNAVVWAKWKLIEGLSNIQLENKILSRTVIGNNVVLGTTDNEIQIVPVTNVWAEQNARLEALMKIHNAYFKE